MKKIFYILFLFFILTGCYQEQEPQLTSEGKWQLTDASLYIKRMGNYPVIRYAYFKPGQDENCMDMAGNCLNLDIIHKNETIWNIRGVKDGGFILNDSLTYEMQCNAWSMRIYPTENGSARVFVLESLQYDYIVWTTSEREQYLDFEGVKDNYTYYSKLEFKRIGL